MRNWKERMANIEEYIENVCFILFLIAKPDQCTFPSSIVTSKRAMMGVLRVKQR